MRPKYLFKLHYSAFHDDIIVDGGVFIRHQLTSRQFSRLRQILISIALDHKLVKRKSK